MNPKYRLSIWVGMLLVVMMPYLSFVFYYSQRFHSGHVPSWFTNTVLIWFTANILALMVLTQLMRKVLPNQVLDAEKARVDLENAVRYSTRLLIFWVALFIVGVIETLRGKVPIERAIPGGIILLFFIGLAGWGLRRAKRGNS